MNSLSNRTHALLMAVVIGGGAIYMAVREAGLARMYSETPWTVSCADLGNDGPGANNHVTLTDFRPCERGYVIYEKKRSSDWDYVYIPICPAAAGGEPPGEQLRIILKVNKVGDEEGLWDQLEAATLTGIVVSTGSRLRGGERRVLSECYPGIDYDRCWVVDIGRRPPDAHIASIALGIGTLLCVGGLGFLVNDALTSRPEQKTNDAPSPAAG